MRAIGGLWRWPHNPLCRTTDLIEAWVALIALLLILLLAPVVGVLAGGSAQDSLQQAVREQRASRHQITATVLRKAPGSSPFRTEPDGGSGRDTHTRVIAEWSAPDGTAHQDAVLSDLTDPRPGDRFLIWTDARGRVATRPLDSATATTHAVLAGFGAALLTAGTAEAARRAAVRHLLRRRYARWDQAWDRAGPDWGRTGTGS
ncbi:hypothetical protein [Streptomyces sp. NPDC018693]|uniref:Rv1733c family protein n=1 Tax=unclassified Streptomyces TaxID=2593676 RepID=UPI0037A8A1FF